MSNTLLITFGAAAGLAATWMGWASVTLVEILREITGNAAKVEQLRTDVEDHEDRIRSLEQHT